MRKDFHRLQVGDSMRLRAFVRARSLRRIDRHPHLNRTAASAYAQIDEVQSGLREKRLELREQAYRFPAYL